MTSATLVTNASVSPTQANAGDRLGQRNRHVYDVQTGAPSAYRACLQPQQRCREYMQVLSTSRTVTTRANMSVTWKARMLRANDFSSKHVYDTKNKNFRVNVSVMSKTKALEYILVTPKKKKESSIKYVCNIKNENSRVNMSVASKTRILE